MALLKVITLDNGITTSYHKVSRVMLVDDNEVNDTASLRFEVTVNSYLNKEYRNNGKSINSNIYRFEITETEEETAVGIRKFAYEKLKTLPIYADAENC